MSKASLSLTLTGTSGNDEPLFDWETPVDHVGNSGIGSGVVAIDRRSPLCRRKSVILQSLNLSANII